METLTHPRLRGELITAPGHVRVWLDDQRRVDLEQAPDDLVVMLRRADGWWPRDDERWDPLLDTLAHHGLADQGPIGRPLSSARVGILGSGTLARQVAVSLARGGVGSLLVHDPREPSPQEWPRSTEPTCGHALARWLGTRRRVTCRPLAGPDEFARRVDLVVVALHTVEPDRLVVDQLVRQDVPHLVLRAHQDLGRVGPFVTPGRTPCLSCHDLVMAHRDHSRAVTVTRLATTRAAPDASIVASVAAQAVLEVGWWVQGHTGRLSGAVSGIDRVVPDLPVARFPAHPDCSCQG